MKQLNYIKKIETSLKDVFYFLFKNDKNMSSCEMTAYWRSLYPNLSGDNISKELASTDGIEKSYLFESKYDYSLIGRKVSVRAGWFLGQAFEQLATNKYDSCISLGSGFSLLTYLIAKKTPNYTEINFVDVDLKKVLDARNLRLKKIVNSKSFDIKILSHIKTSAINLEQAFESGIKFKDLFNQSEAPIFILEGIIYFLSKNCVRWIFEGISTFKNYSIIFDYWPQDALLSSTCFKNMLTSLNNFIPEQVTGLLNKEELDFLCKLTLVKDTSLQEVEHNMSLSNHESPQLININQFIPVRLRTIEAI